MVGDIDPKIRCAIEDNANVPEIPFGKVTIGKKGLVFLDGEQVPIGDNVAQLPPTPLRQNFSVQELGTIARQLVFRSRGKNGIVNGV